MVKSILSVCATQESEMDAAAVVIVAEPSMDVFMCSLNPAGSLYEVPLDMDQSVAEHKNYQEVLRRHGCTVYRVIDILTMEGSTPEEQAATRADLEDLAAQALTYTLLNPGHIVVPQDIAHYASDAYKREVLAKMSREKLAWVILTRPTVAMEVSDHNTPLVTKLTSFNPVGNIVFTRDQQITTARGVVLGCFNAVQRRLETRIMEFCWRKLGARIVGDVMAQNKGDVIDHTLEGGDYLCLTRDIAYQGVGLRSTYKSARYLMDNDLLGTKYFVVAKDTFELSQDIMHADCYMSPLHDKLVALDEYVTKGDGLRYVDEYERVEDGKGGKARYVLRKAGVELQQYLTDRGFTIIRLPHEYQLAYGINSLSLGNNTIIAVHEPSIRFIQESPEFKKYCADNHVAINIEYVPFRGITSMFGSLHCSSQVVTRTQNAAAKAVQNEKPEAFKEDKRIDAILYVPSFATAYIKNKDFISVQQKLVAEAYELFQRLKSEGKRVYIWNKYPGDKLISMKECKGAKTIDEAIDRLLATTADFGAKGAGKGSSVTEKELGLSMEDRVYYF